MPNTNDQILIDGEESLNNPSKGRQGFASMSQDKQKTIASKGGKAAHAQGTAHEWDSNEARTAGRKGGQVRQGNLKQEDIGEVI